VKGTAATLGGKKKNTCKKKWIGKLFFAVFRRAFGVSCTVKGGGRKNTVGGRGGREKGVATCLKRGRKSKEKFTATSCPGFLRQTIGAKKKRGNHVRSQGGD